MKVNQAKFIISAAEESQWPADDLSEIVLCGRSNVGKSSFINTMINRKNLAYTSSTPGMTRTLNFYDLDHKLRFVDAPGYGYQKKAKSGYEAFSRIMSAYFSRRSNLKLCILLLDVRREPNADDKSMLEFIQQNHLPCLIVLTKCDKLSNNQIAKQLKLISESLDVSKDVILKFSSLKKTGVEEMWQRIEAYI